MLEMMEMMDDVSLAVDYAPDVSPRSFFFLKL